MFPDVVGERSGESISSEDEQFAELYAHDGQPALCPSRLALVTVVQFAKNLPDRQAADAVRSRIDLKYLLGLELTDPGFDYSPFLAKPSRPRLCS